MKKELFKEIEIPEGVDANIEENLLILKGAKGENKKRFNIHGLKFEKKENKIIIGSKKATKTEKKMMNTIIAHIQNLIKGVQEKFEYQLKICSSHFPMSVEIKDNKAIIKNFIGEKIARTCIIPKGAEVSIKGPTITISSIDKEIAGQAAANFEKATRISMKDRRIFQDGIYITNKAGKEI